ncbi:MAG: ribosomal RNA small subunit methyltransferase A [Clostridia bacterium]|nr:ribosomal RNA small subunit methyltransferase A [Clostridia bacterium]
MEYTIPQIKQLLIDNGFSFQKALGQNFLINPSVCPRMAEQCGCDGIGALEIGPGAGVLTMQLAKRAKKVVAVELDKKLTPVLAQTLADFPNAEVVWGDAMKLDLAALIREKFAGMEVVVCANLPYYITSPLLMRLLEERLPIKRITVMLQKEAAQRICEAPPSRDCGAISYSIRYYSNPSPLFDVSRGSFYPPPNVDSRVITLEVLAEPSVTVSDEKLYFDAVSAAFAQRRKTLSNALSAVFGKERAAAALQQSGVEASLRAEQLTPQQFAAVANALAACR